jgi:hypothetical protein
VEIQSDVPREPRLRYTTAPKRLDCDYTNRVGVMSGKIKGKKVYGVTMPKVKVDEQVAIYRTEGFYAGAFDELSEDGYYEKPEEDEDEDA